MLSGQQALPYNDYLVVMAVQFASCHEAAPESHLSCSYHQPRDFVSENVSKWDFVFFFPQSICICKYYEGSPIL